MTMVISGSDGITFPDSTNQFSGGAFSFKNRIINGDMRIDQRNAGAAVTTTGSFPVDRMRISDTTDGAYSAQQDSSAPEGFVNSVKFTTTTEDTSLTTTQSVVLSQFIEGTNVSDLGFGTASAKTVTLSFWVRSSLTGTFGGALRNNGSSRSYPFTYSISVADTWEYKTVTIPGDTTGTWLTTTSVGTRVTFGLGVGPDRSGTAGAWAGANYLSATGAISVIGTLNATWFITGVQLEVGSVATPFERRPFGTELALCQRYAWAVRGTNQFFNGFMRTTTNFTGSIQFPVTMRAAASLTSANSASYFGIGAGGSDFLSPVVSVAGGGTQISESTVSILSTIASGSSTVGFGAQLSTNNASAFLLFTAEL
jgi:hypothetical protein